MNTQTLLSDSRTLLNSLQAQLETIKHIFIKTKQPPVPPENPILNLTQFLDESSLTPDARAELERRKKLQQQPDRGSLADFLYSKLG